MKKNLLIFCFLHFSMCLLSQVDTYVDFDFSNSLTKLYIDTISNPTNIWQIAKPLKNTLNSPQSAPNVIITDSINSYPINDTSSFILFHKTGWGISSMQHIGLSGWYYVNSDSITDYGKIELSTDNGLSWLNITENNEVYWWGWAPTLSGNSNGWKVFEVNFISLVNINEQLADTFQIRFSFISDSIHSNRDGLMFDNLAIYEYVEGLDEINSTLKTVVYPNPTDEYIKIEIEFAQNEEYDLTIFDSKGLKLSSQKIKNEDLIDVKYLPSGFYQLLISNEFGSSKGNFVKK